jgi:hypothetical protein
LNIQPNPTPKVKKKLDVQSTFNVKNPFWVFVGFKLDYWIGLDFFSSIQTNNPIKIQQKSKNPTFLDF